MKNIKLIFFLSLILFSACQKNEDTITTDDIIPGSTAITTVDMVLEGFVFEANSLFKWNQHVLEMHNVDVQLIYDDVILDETNTNGQGAYNFPSQPVPVEGAYLVFSAPGYHSNVLKIDTTDNSSAPRSRYLLRKSFENIEDEAISNSDDFITIKGHLQNPTAGQDATFFITNTSGDLIGNYTSSADLRFEFTTVANEELFFHYKFPCFVSDPIALGPFSEDTDLGTLLDQSYDFSDNYIDGEIISDDCDGSFADGYVLVTRNNSTIHSQMNTEYSEKDCILEQDNSAYVTYVNTSPRKYGEQLINYSSGQSIDLSISTCENDDTYFLYSIGGSPIIDPDLYTFADVLPDGRTILKQVDPTFNGEIFITFEFEGSTPGNMNGDVRFYGFSGIQIGGESLTVEITLNDGEFIEGTVSGAVFNPLEVSLGSLIGTFRARVH